MSNKAVEIIDDLNDLDAVRFVKYLGVEIFEEISGKDIISNIPETLRSIPELGKLENLPQEQRKTDISPQESIKIARDLLYYFANDKELGPIVESSWNDFNNESDELFIEAVLGIGFVGSLILFTATTEIEGEIGKIKFKKKKASPEMVEALAKAAFNCLKQTLA